MCYLRGYDSINKEKRRMEIRDSPLCISALQDILFFKLKNQLLKKMGKITLIAALLLVGVVFLVEVADGGKCD